MLTLTILVFFAVCSFPIEDPQGMVFDILFYDNVQNGKMCGNYLFYTKNKKEN